MKLPRWRLFPKYATLIIAVVAGVLVISGAINLVFSWREIQSHLVALQMEKAQGAASRIEQYVLDIEHQIGWTAFIRTDPSIDPIEQRRLDYLKLLKQVPAITELVWITPDGRERIARISPGVEHDRRRHRPVQGAGVHRRAGRQDLVRAGAVPQGHRAVHGDCTAGWRRRRRHGGRRQPEVRVGRGVAHQDRDRTAWPTWSIATGTLIAHPDISLVLKKTDMLALPQVAALDRPIAPPA